MFFMSGFLHKSSSRELKQEQKWLPFKPPLIFNYPNYIV
jgi:hypothetical protein